MNQLAVLERPQVSQSKVNEQFEQMLSAQFDPNTLSPLDETQLSVATEPTPLTIEEAVNTVRFSTVYGRNEATGNYEAMENSPIRALGAVALDRAGIAIASAESYLDVSRQGALKGAQEAQIAKQQHEMFRQLDDMLLGDSEEYGPDGKKKKRKKKDFQLTT